jgi:hypothetical protein
VLAAAVTGPVWAVEHPAVPGPARAVLATADGLALTLDAATGTATNLRVDGSECLREPHPLVSLETVDTRRPGRNLIADGGFEGGASEWELPTGALRD